MNGAPPGKVKPEEGRGLPQLCGKAAAEPGPLDPVGTVWSPAQSPFCSQTTSGPLLPASCQMGLGCVFSSQDLHLKQMPGSPHPGRGSWGSPSQCDIPLLPSSWGRSEPASGFVPKPQVERGFCLPFPQLAFPCAQFCTLDTAVFPGVVSFSGTCLFLYISFQSSLGLFAMCQALT